MDRPNVPSHQSEGYIEENHTVANYIPKDSTRPSLSQAPVPPRPQLMPSLPSNRAEPYCWYSAGNLGSWTLNPDISRLQPPQPITITRPSSTTDASPIPSSDLHDHISTDASSPFSFSSPVEPLQEPASWISSLFPLPTHQHQTTDAISQHMLIPVTMASLRDHPVFQCKWEGCTSSTRFHREGDLVRHLKTIHISPGAFPCREPSCKWTFGRKDHLQQHKSRVHRR